jgi:ribonuclease D
MPHAHAQSGGSSTASHGPIPPLLTTAAELRSVVLAVQRSPLVAFDTEFHSERTYKPQLMLVQVATAEGIWLLDPLTIDLRPLMEAMAGRLVVGHALKNDLRIVWLNYGLLFPQVFDTQIAASLLGYGLQIGLSGLLLQTLGVHQPKGEQMSDWSQRPLPDKLRGYAAGDVANLLPLYDQLHGRLSERNRLAWLQEECAELAHPERYERDPDEVWLRVSGARKLSPKEAGVLAALAAERERLALEEDMVPHFLMPDDTLLALAKTAPRHKREIEGDRRLQQRGVQRYAARWVEAVERGLKQPIQREASRPPPPAELEPVVSLALLVVGDIAQREAVAQGLLVKRDQLTEALREPRADADALAEAAGLHGWRRDLLAQPLWQLVAGKLGVRCGPGQPLELRLEERG